MMAPAFAADCVETLEEIEVEIREAFLHAGGEGFTYIPCLNAEAAHVEMMVGDPRARARRLALSRVRPPRGRAAAHQLAGAPARPPRPGAIGRPR